MSVTVCYQDEYFLIANKPSGLLCVPGLKEPDNLYDRVLKIQPNARVVHRLDMATSGLVIFALSYEAQKKLSKLFETKRIQKQYCAVVSGKLSDKKGEIISPLICDWEARPKQKVDWISGKQSHTLYEVQSYEALGTRVKLFPITGRTHQLRVHMEQIGHPIQGDQLYCHPNINDTADRLLLHAESVSFMHPFKDNERFSLTQKATF